MRMLSIDSHLLCLRNPGSSLKFGQQQRCSVVAREDQPHWLRSIAENRDDELWKGIEKKVFRFRGFLVSSRYLARMIHWNLRTTRIEAINGLPLSDMAGHNIRNVVAADARDVRTLKKQGTEPR